MEKKEQNMTLVAIIAIVAIVGVVALVLSSGGSAKRYSKVGSLTFGDDENQVGAVIVESLDYDYLSDEFRFGAGGSSCPNKGQTCHDKCGKKPSGAIKLATWNKCVRECASNC